MAGGKMSARQKMINLMYLVFIAMLAMNMSKEVLSAFGYNKQDLDSNIITLTKKNDQGYSALKTKAEDQPKIFGPIKLKADSIRVLSNNFYSQLQALKDSMLVNIPIEDRLDYESMDKTDWTNRFFKGDGYSEYGKEFFDNIINYKKGISAVLGSSYPALAKTIVDRFPTEDQTNSKGIKVKFLKYYYEGFPMVASLNNFTSLQSKIKTSENDVTTTLVGGAVAAEVALDNFKAIVRLDKSTYYEGEKVTGQVILGRYDENFLPKKVMLGTVDITNDVTDGQVMINTSAGRIGKKDIKGEITYLQDGEAVQISFETEYEVIKSPNKAVVSADKMNVVYRGIENPISVSLPGVNKFNVSFTGVKTNKKTKSGYLITPGAGVLATAKDGKKVRLAYVNVSATLNNGKRINSKEQFRVKDLPTAVLMVDGETANNIELPAEILTESDIEVGLPDFDFDLKIRTVKFDVFVPGQFAISVNGSRLNAAAKAAINKARNGDVIRIGNIKASVIGSNYVLPQVYGGSITIVN